MVLHVGFGISHACVRAVNPSEVKIEASRAMARNHHPLGVAMAWAREDGRDISGCIAWLFGQGSLTRHPIYVVLIRLPLDLLLTALGGFVHEGVAQKCNPPDAGMIIKKQRLRGKRMKPPDREAPKKQRV
jgi:hypothetical protein